MPWEENVISVEEFNKQNFKLCSKVDHDCPCEDETKYKVKRKEAGKLSGIGEEHLNNAKEAEKEAAKAGEEPIKQEKEKEVENELLKAEDAFDRALKFDEEHVRAMYGKGKTLLGKGQKGAAEKIFRKLSTIEATFEEENRHIFNELGMDLRKLKMLDDAIDMYKKAIEIDSEAPALYVNLARVYANKQKIESTFKNLEIAIEKGEQIVVDEQHTHYADFGRKELEKVKEIYNNFKPLKSSRKENPKDGEAKKTELDIDPDLYDNYFIV